MELNDLINLLNSKNADENIEEKITQIINTLAIHPQHPIILIGGTNGKGSVCAYLTTILTNAGFKVGTFTSPHVLKYNERIMLNNQNITDQELQQCLERVINWNKDADFSLGLFKTFTLAAHLFFMQKQIDIAVIEVGIGGKNDITNLFEPTISAITNVAFDHQTILGNTLEAIGKEKAGIFRPNKWGFFGNKEVPQSVLKWAKQTNLLFYGKDFTVTRHPLHFDVNCSCKNFYALPYPAMRGYEQPENVALALAIISKLPSQFTITLATIKTSILQTKLLGRLQIMPGTPQIILDVAHNPKAVEAMLMNLDSLPKSKQQIAVFACAIDKDSASIINLCKEYFTYWFISEINSPRACPISKLRQTLINNGINPQQIVANKTITEAINKARESTTIHDRIVAFGSFLVVEEAYYTLTPKNIS